MKPTLATLSSAVAAGLRYGWVTPPPPAPARATVVRRALLARGGKNHKRPELKGLTGNAYQAAYKRLVRGRACRPLQRIPVNWMNPKKS